MDRLKILILGILIASPITSFGYTITTNSGNTGVDSFGNSSAFTVDKVGEPFTTSALGDTQNIQVSIEKVGSPSDNVQIAIQADSGGTPSGINLATGTISGSSWPSSCGTYQTVTLTTTSLSATTNYWVVYSRTGSPDNTNYYATCGAGSPISDIVHLNSVWTTGDGQNGLTLSIVPPSNPGDYSSSSPVFLGTASSTFETLTGIDTGSVIDGLTNAGKFAIGSVLVFLDGLKYWVLAGMAMVVICGLILYAFKFFKTP